MIAVGGGSASGKTTVAEMLKTALKGEKATVICQDSFYRELNKEQYQLAKNKEYNFDHPKAFDNDLLLKSLKKLSAGETAQIPNYSYVTMKRTNKTTTVLGATVIILEGIYALYDPNIRNLMDIKLFVDTDADTRIIRRLKRDVKERGWDFDYIVEFYEKFVKPSFEKFILPTRKYADLIIPRGGGNFNISKQF
eukprot:gene9225-1311_t